MAEPSGRRVLGALLAVAAPERRRLALAVTLGVAAAGCSVGLAATSAWLIDRAAQRPAILSLTAVMGTVQLLAFGKAGLRYAERLATHDAAFRVLGRLRVWCLAALEPLAPAGLGGRRSGELLDALVGDVDTLQNLYVRALPPLAVASVVAVGAVAVEAAVLPVAGATLGAGLLLATAAVPGLGRWLAAPVADDGERRGALAGDVVELVRGSAELAVFGAAARWRDRILAHDDALAAQARRRAFRHGAVEATAVAVAGGTVAGLAVLAALAVAHGRLPAVDVAVVPVLGVAAFEVAGGLPAAFSHLAGDLAAGRRLLGVTTAPDPAPDPPVPVRAPAGVPGIALERATLRYDPAAAPALAGVDLAVPPGGCLALTGPSGSGKTSAVHALLRFWSLESGHARLGAVDEAALAGADVRGHVGAALHDTHVFGASLRANLALARPGADDAAVWAALDRVGLAPWAARLPAGLDTVLGEAGATVSGGERQRLGLARLLLADRPVVVLDEPTAHLDRPTARRVLDAVLRACAGRTVLLVTHRAAEAAACPAELTLRAGRVVARRQPEPTAAERSA